MEYPNQRARIRGMEVVVDCGESAVELYHRPH